MKKKIIPVLLCATMVFTLAGCGGSSDDEEETTTQEEAEESADENAGEEDAEAEEEAGEEESVVDQVEEFRYMETDDGIACWNIYMKEDADYDNYLPEDYTEILKACLDNPENKEDGVTGFSIQALNQDGLPVFTWFQYDDDSTIKQDVWRSDQTNPDYYDQKLSSDQLNDIYSVLNE